MDCGGFRRLVRCLAIIGTTFAITWGNALAAPPQEPPGNSEHAPGQQKHESGEASGQELAPGHEKKELLAATAPAANANVTHRSTERPVNPKRIRRSSRPSLTDSTRYVNPQGKPKRNVPVVAETAPTASASGPGKSGIHKLTLCHNGHAITVDVHAAAAHLKHGDTFLPAGAKGRACGAEQVRSSARPSTDNLRRAHVRSSTLPDSTDVPASERSTPTPEANPTPGPAAAFQGVLGEQIAATAARDSTTRAVTTSSAAQLPFTGSAVTRFLVAGILLIALGCVLTLGGRGRLLRVCAEAAAARPPARRRRS